MQFINSGDAAAKYPDGYGFLSSAALKALCWIPAHTKALDFAQAHDIRLYSRRYGRQAKTDKEFYFLMDARPHFRTLPKK